MGLSTVTLQVGNPASPDVTEAVAFLIDSGAIYSIVPSAVLERLGITPLAAEQFHLADGTTITRKKGIALFRYGDRVGGADIPVEVRGAMPFRGERPHRGLAHDRAQHA